MQTKDPRREFSRESLWSQQTVTTLSSTNTNPEPLLVEEPDAENQVQLLTEPLLQKFNEQLKQQQKLSKKRPKLSMQSGFKFQRMATSAKLSISPSMRDQQELMKPLLLVIIVLMVVLVTSIFALFLLLSCYRYQQLIFALIGWIFLDIVALLYVVQCFVFKCSRFLYEIEVSEKKGFQCSKTICFFQNPKLEYTWQSKAFPISDFYCVRATKAQIPRKNRRGSNASSVIKSNAKMQPNLDPKNNAKNVQDAENVRYIIEVHTKHNKIMRFSVYGSYAEMLERCKQMTRFVTMMKEVLKVQDQTEIKRRGRIQINDSNQKESTISIYPQFYLQKFRFLQYFLAGVLLWTCYWIIYLTNSSIIAKSCVAAIVIAAVTCKMALCYNNVMTKLRITKQQANYSNFQINQYFPLFGYFMIPIYHKKGVSNRNTEMFLQDNNLCLKLNDKKSIKLSSLLTSSLLQYLSIYYPFDNAMDFQLACDVVNRELNPQQQM